MTDPTKPLILPLGDAALLVRFGDSLSEGANRAAVRFAARAEAGRPAGVVEVVPNLVSVLLRYDPCEIAFERLAGEVLLLLRAPEVDDAPGRTETVAVRFDGEDVPEVARTLGLSVEHFVELHNREPLRVLSTGFAPGFVYCGFHDAALRIARRGEVRRRVEAGTVLFAAGQTAITSTPIPTGWHVIGHCAFRNFDVDATPPVRVVAGDAIRFVPA